MVSSFKIEPPQKWANVKNECSWKLIWYGKSPCFAIVPPTILLCGSGTLLVKGTAAAVEELMYINTGKKLGKYKNK